MDETINNTNTNTNTNECSICLHIIESETNKVTTECGHMFHTNCLMKNISHNGFGCPYCRSKMIEETAEEVSEDDVEVSESEDEADDIYDDGPFPSFEYIIENASNFGLNIEDLIKAFLHIEYYDRSYANCLHSYGKVIGKIEHILFHYRNNLPLPLTNIDNEVNDVIEELVVDIVNINNEDEENN